MRFSTSHILLFLLVACVDRIAIDATGEFKSQIVVDGFISDEPGPYVVRLFRSSSVEDVLNSASPFSARAVSIYDNLGNIEPLTETSNGSGVYVTRANGIRGVLGRAYTLKIENRDGTIYESTREVIRPAGKVDSIYTEFESFKPQQGPTEYGYRVYMNSSIDEKGDNYFRWRFKGTYRVETNPELHDTPFGQGRIPDPRPCSGFIYNGNLVQVGPCFCCTCWVTQPEKKPIVSDNQFVTGGKFNKVEVGFVPVNAFTFFDRYQIEVKQLSLSAEAFEFWRIIQSQKEGATSLFQPPFGQAMTNIHPTNGGPPILGIFYASSVAKKTKFILKSEVPVPVPNPSAIIPEACNTTFELASVNKPFDWN